MKGLLGMCATTPLSHLQGGILREEWEGGGHLQTGLDCEHMKLMGVVVSPSPTFLR